MVLIAKSTYYSAENENRPLRQGNRKRTLRPQISSADSFENRVRNALGERRGQNEMLVGASWQFGAVVLFNHNTLY